MLLPLLVHRGHHELQNSAVIARIFPAVYSYLTFTPKDSQVGIGWGAPESGEKSNMGVNTDSTSKGQGHQV